jgi:hypothetical protein
MPGSPRRRRGARPPGRQCRATLHRVPGQRVREAVTDPIEQALRDRLVNERKAPGGGFVQRGRDERDREVTPDDGRGLHQPAAAGGDTIEPGADDVEHSARRSVRIPGALGHRRGDLADEQRIAAGDIENSPGVGLLYSLPDNCSCTSARPKRRRSRRSTLDDRYRRRRDGHQHGVPSGWLFPFRDAADVDQHRAALATGSSGPVQAPYSVVTALSHARLVRNHNEDSIAIGQWTLCASETETPQTLVFPIASPGVVSGYGTHLMTLLARSTANSSPSTWPRLRRP